MPKFNLELFKTLILNFAFIHSKRRKLGMFTLFQKYQFVYRNKQKFYVSSKQEKEWYMERTSYLEQPSRHFCQHFMQRTTQQTLLAINLASQQKTTKLFFSSQVRKQFKLLAVPFKPLRCCLQNDKLVNCKLTRELICQLFNCFLWFCWKRAIIWLLVEITSCVCTKTIILFNLGE